MSKAKEFFDKDNGLYTSYSVKNKDGKFTPVCSYERAIEFAKYILEKAAENARIDRKPTGEGNSSEEYTSVSFEADLGYEEYIPVEFTINKESITDTLNQYL